MFNSTGVKLINPYSSQQKKKKERKQEKQIKKKSNQQKFSFHSYIPGICSVQSNLPN